VSKGYYGLAKAINTADDKGSAGDDTIYAGNGGNVFSGDSLSIKNAELGGGYEGGGEGNNQASAYAFNTAGDGGSAGNDLVISGHGDDLGAGDALEIAKFAHAHTENEASDWGSGAGNDTIHTDGGDDAVSGGSLAKGTFGALA